MGRRGPAPKPTALRVIEGNPAKRPLPEHEPKPKRGTPRCPRVLTPAGKTAWRQVTKMLDAMGLLTVVDGHMLERYCDGLVRWRAAAAFLQKHGEVYPIKDDKGNLRYMQQFPQVSIYAKLDVALRRMEEQFGMSPAARTRIQVAVDANEPDDFAVWMAKTTQPKGA